MNRPFRPWIVDLSDRYLPTLSVRVTRNPFIWLRYTYRYYHLLWLTRNGPVRAEMPKGNPVRLVRNGRSIKVYSGFEKIDSREVC